MIKIYNKTDQVWGIGYNDCSLQFNPGEEGFEIPYSMFVERRDWFTDMKERGILDFEENEETAPAPVATIVNSDITVDQINSNTGAPSSPVTNTENTPPAPVATEITPEELAGLEGMTIDALRDIAKRIGAEPAKKSSDLIANIRTKATPAPPVE